VKSPNCCTVGVACTTNDAAATARMRTEIHLDTGIGD
jgi:hypothetical protein